MKTTEPTEAGSLLAVILKELGAFTDG